MEAGCLEEFTELHIVPTPSGDKLVPTSQRSKWKERLSAKPLADLDEKQDHPPLEKLNSIWAYLTGAGRRRDTNMDEKRLRALPICNEEHLDEVLRLHYIAQSHHGSSDNHLSHFSCKPFNVHASLAFLNLLKTSCTCVKFNKRRNLIVRVCKILSPMERDARDRKQKKGGPEVSLEQVNKKSNFVLCP